MLKNQKQIIWIAVTLILIAAVFFYFNNIRIPGIKAQLEREVRAKVDVVAMPKKTIAVVIDKAGIPKYTHLTPEYLTGKIALTEVPVDFVAPNAAFDLDIIKNKIAMEDLRFGEQVALDSLSTEKKWYGDYDRLKEFAVKSIVAGEVKPGNIVDLVVNYKNGTYDIVVPKTKVRKILKAENKEGKTNVLIFSLDEVSYRDVQLASKLGDLETRLYIDDNQKASAKTFNYPAATLKIPSIKVESGNDSYTIIQDEPLTSSNISQSNSGSTQN